MKTTTLTPSETCGFSHYAGPVEASHHLYGRDGMFLPACYAHTEKWGSAFWRVTDRARMVTSETVGTDALRTGDIVQFYGARLLLDREITSWSGSIGQPVYGTSAAVQNWDELLEIARINPDSPAASIVRCAPERRWDIQGNARARWIREKATQQ
ncbi:hypothetical protein [Nocardia sp. NPDC050435]|uniref:hypothetical protein n=1 Tax=Nocardia sp. NPDC050435 TaxID=3155040 RepID=UPI0033C30938